MNAILFFVIFILQNVQIWSLNIETTYQPSGCSEPGARLVKAGDLLSVHYTGSIDESSRTGVKGKIFDSSLTRGSPLDFTVGAGQVIMGWDKGFLNMCVGEKRTLIIEPEMGYGNSGAGKDIPGGATLKFTVELMAISEQKSADKRAQAPNVFAEMDANKDAKISYDEMEAWFQKRSGASGSKSIPPNVWEREDKNGDRFITWEEFSGPKGTEQPVATEEL